MAENSAIEWTDHTFNPWIGCQKISTGCQHCYAEALMDKRYGKVEWGPQGTRQRTSEANWKKPFTWNRKAEREGVRYKVFCASLGDVFEDNDQLSDWRLDLFEHVIAKTPNLDWLILTKRPEIAKLFFWQRRDLLLGNVWIGTSVEDQAAADARLPYLYTTPAAVRFISAEPLLGPVDLRFPFASDNPYMTLAHADWVIVGGESGHGARCMNPDWVISIKRQCEDAGIPFFFKQTGTILAKEWSIKGKGDKLEELPKEFRVRQFPALVSA